MDKATNFVLLDCRCCEALDVKPSTQGEVKRVSWLHCNQLTLFIGNAAPS